MHKARQYWVYIMASRTGVLYTGVTNGLERRVYEHQHGLLPGFTQKYRVKRLVYFEAYRDVRDAIAREKEIKGWRREKKTILIEKMNPGWSDLSETWKDGQESHTSLSSRTDPVAGASGEIPRRSAPRDDTSERG